MALGPAAAYPSPMRIRVPIPLCAVLAIGLSGALAHAQFNPQGRGKKVKPPAAAPQSPAGARGARKPRAVGASPAAGEPGGQQGAQPAPDALIARYTGIVLAQPGAEFPLQRLTELYRARDGKLDGLIEEMGRRAEQAGPQRFAALLALAGAYKSDGRLDEALAVYERAASEAPDTAVAELALARLLAERGERDKAKERYERALTRVKEPVLREEVHRTLMTLALDTGDVAEAKKQHEELVRLQKGSFFVRAELGRELSARGLHEQAVIELAGVVKAVGGDNRVLSPALRDYGRALSKVGRRQEALAQLTRALAIAGSQAGVRREIYETIVELYRADDRLSVLVAELERRGARDADEERVLASLYEETGKLDKALAAYRSVLRRDPKDIGTRLKVVHILEVQGQLDDAVREYEALTIAAPRNPDFVFRLAEALIQRGDRTSALTHLRRLEARSGDDDEILAALVDFYERVDEKAGSLALLQRLSARGSSDPQHLVELGSRYWQQGDKKKALATWQRIRAIPDRIQGLLILGELYLEHDLIPEALATLEEAVRIEPKQVRLRRAYALALERAGTGASLKEGRQTYHERALKVWEQILKENVNSQLAREARQHIVTLWSLGGSLAPRASGLERRLKATPPDLDAGRLLAEAQVRLRRYPEAERTLRTIVAANPGDVESLLRLERVLGLERKLSEAILVLERLARADPKRAREYYQRMAEYAAELYRDDDAIRFASRSVELSPEDAEGHKKLGELQRKRGEVTKAIASFRKAISKNERLFPVYFELAELLLSQGQVDEADGLLRRVVRACPDEELIVRAARLSLQVNLGKGAADPLERDLLPLALDNPDRPIYRRLLVELYGALAYPLLHRASSGSGPDALEAEVSLRRLGERAVKPLLDALSDERDAQQETATTLLTYVANKSAGPALFAYATGNAAPRLRARAMLALGALNDPALAPKLGDLLAPEGKARAEESDPVLLAAAWSLCRLESRAARAPLVALSASPAPALRTFGILGLALLGDTRSATLVGRALTATEAGSLPRAAAAFAVGELGLSQYSSVLSELVDAPDPALQSAAIVALSRVAPGSASERVARLLLSANSEVRPAARAAALILASGAYRRSGSLLPIPSGDLDMIQVLAHLLPNAYGAAEEQQALSRLAPALESAARAQVRSSPEGARAVADALSLGSGKVPFSALLIASATDPRTRTEADRLADRISAAIVPSYISLAGHPAADVRSFALVFLAGRSEPEAAQAVILALGDQDSEVRRTVLALLEPKHAEASGALIALSTSELWSDRAAAAAALGRITRHEKPEQSVRALERLATEDTTALVREAALSALARGAPLAARRVLVRVRDSDPEPQVRRAARVLLGSSSSPKP